ncbi:hypothetical protein BGZ63DRAFT_397282 [Mariannaea sp. PMI_226]|nr:hypothetical protein BGZ63DRAFT_397282 [Mariannaea sp. PMI_226]
MVRKLPRYSKRGTTPEEKWKCIYEAIFPEERQFPEPYLDATEVTQVRNPRKYINSPQGRSLVSKIVDGNIPEQDVPKTKKSIIKLFRRDIPQRLATHHSDYRQNNLTDSISQVATERAYAMDADQIGAMNLQGTESVGLQPLLDPVAPVQSYPFMGLDEPAIEFGNQAHIAIVHNDESPVATLTWPEPELLSPQPETYQWDTLDDSLGQQAYPNSQTPSFPDLMGDATPAEFNHTFIW